VAEEAKKLEGIREAEAKKLEDLIQQEAKRLEGIRDLEKRTNEYESELQDLKGLIYESKQELGALRNDPSHDLAEMGAYSPIYDFYNSKAYEVRLVDIRSRQEGLLTAKGACQCDKDWSVDGSRAEGKKIITS